MVAVLGLHVHVGMGAFAAVVILTLVKAADEEALRDAVGRHPHGVRSYCTDVDAGKNRRNRRLYLDRGAAGDPPDGDRADGAGLPGWFRFTAVAVTSAFAEVPVLLPSSEVVIVSPSHRRS